MCALGMGVGVCDPNKTQVSITLNNISNPNENPCPDPTPNLHNSPKFVSGIKIFLFELIEI